MLRLSKLQNRLSQRAVFVVIALTCGMAILSSIFTEHVLRLSPCYLCSLQRGAYCLLFCVATAGRYLPLAAMLRVACVAILLFLSGISSYHTLVQLKIVKDRCGSQVQIGDVTSYKHLLLEQRRPTCSEMPWKIGPVPIAALNGCISLALLGLMLVGRKNPEN
jgi:disulfide bond formation protein DsbB